MFTGHFTPSGNMDFFHPYLCGSVIEMFRISELKTLMRNFIIPALEKSSQNPEMTLKIKSTWELEKKIEQQAKAVKELRDSLVRRYYLSMINFLKLPSGSFFFFQTRLIKFSTKFINEKASNSERLFFIQIVTTTKDFFFFHHLE